MLTILSRLRSFFEGRQPAGLPGWMQAIGVELELRYDMAREPMPDKMTDALSKMSEAPRSVVGPADELSKAEAERIDRERAA